MKTNNSESALGYKRLVVHKTADKSSFAMFSIKEQVVTKPSLDLIHLSHFEWVQLSPALFTVVHIELFSQTVIYIKHMVPGLIVPDES